MQHGTVPFNKNMRTFHIKTVAFIKICEGLKYCPHPQTNNKQIIYDTLISYALLLIWNTVSSENLNSVVGFNFNYS